MLEALSASHLFETTVRWALSLMTPAKRSRISRVWARESGFSVVRSSPFVPPSFGRPSSSRTPARCAPSTPAFFSAWTKAFFTSRIVDALIVFVFQPLRRPTWLFTLSSLPPRVRVMSPAL